MRFEQADLDEQHAALTQQLQEASCDLQKAQQQAADEVNKLQEEQSWLRQKLNQTEGSLQVLNHMDFRLDSFKA